MASRDLTIRTTVATVCDGLLAAGEQDWAKAARLLEDVLPGLPRVGGSAAQREISRASRHELGVLTFAALLRRSGAEVIYVGADLPSDSWAVAAATSGVGHVVLGVPTEEDVPGVRDAVAALAAAVPEVTVHVGGGHQDEIGPPAHQLGHRLVAGAQDLAASLGATAPATGPSAPGSRTTAP